MIAKMISLLAAFGLMGSGAAKMALSNEARTHGTKASHPSQFAPGVASILFDGGGGSGGGGSTDGDPPGHILPTPW